MEMTELFLPENKPGAVDLGLGVPMTDSFVKVSVTCVVVVTIVARLNTAGTAPWLGFVVSCTSEEGVAAVVPDKIDRSEFANGSSDLFS